MPERHTSVATSIIRDLVQPPDGGAAWLTLYEGDSPEAEPVEDKEDPTWEPAPAGLS